MAKVHVCQMDIQLIIPDGLSTCMSNGYTTNNTRWLKYIYVKWIYN